MSTRRRHLFRFLLTAVDLAACCAVLSSAVPGSAWSARMGGALVYVALALLLGLQDPQKTPNPITRLWALGLAAVGWGVVLGLGDALHLFGEELAGQVGIGEVALVALGAWLGRWALHWTIRPFQIPVVIQGRGPKALRVARAIMSQRYGSLRVLGIRADGDSQGTVIDARAGSSELEAVPDDFGLNGRPWNFRTWTLTPGEGPGDGTSARVKRTLDIILALAVLPFLLLIILPLALVLWIQPPHRPLYRQIRLTQGGRRFRIIKLRSMKLDAEPDEVPVWPQAEDPRITPLGKWMRTLWLDELPQIWNILIGDLSWVGPRPERPEFAQVFSERLPKYALRHQAKAGMTGLAQIRGFAGNTSLRKRLICDLEYIRTWSPWLDAHVLLGTLCQLFVRRRQPVFEFVPGDGGRIP